MPLTKLKASNNVVTVFFINNELGTRILATKNQFLLNFMWYFLIMLTINVIFDYNSLITFISCIFKNSLSVIIIYLSILYSSTG